MILAQLIGKGEKKDIRLCCIFAFNAAETSFDFIGHKVMS